MIFSVTRMSEMDVRVISLPKYKLDRIPELERAFYIHIGHLRNELMFLQKMLWWSNNNPTDHTVLQNINVSQGLAIIRLMAGKLWGGWGLVHKSYYGSKVSMSIGNKIPLKSRQALTELKEYFKKENTIRMVRNQFAFHYSPQYIRDQLAQIEDTDQMEVYMAALNVNTFYPFSEVIANGAMLNAVDADDYMAGLKVLMDEV